MFFQLQEDVFTVNESKERDYNLQNAINLPDIIKNPASVWKVGHVLSLYIFLADEHLNQYLILKEYQCMRFYIFIHELILS